VSVTVTGTMTSREVTEIRSDAVASAVYSDTAIEITTSRPTRRRGALAVRIEAPGFIPRRVFARLTFTLASFARFGKRLLFIRRRL
jgi:hypothetical protein